MVHIILAAALGRVGHVLGGGALGAHEQHAAALGGYVAHFAQRAIQHRHGLLQVDDVHLVAHAEQERRHARVPAAGVVAEVNTGFEQLAQREIGHRHGGVILSKKVRLSLRGELPAGTGPGALWPREEPRVWITAAYPGGGMRGGGRDMAESGWPRKGGAWPGPARGLGVAWAWPGRGHLARWRGRGQ